MALVGNAYKLWCEPCEWSRADSDGWVGEGYECLCFERLDWEFVERSTAVGDRDDMDIDCGGGDAPRDG